MASDSPKPDPARPVSPLDDRVSAEQPPAPDAQSDNASSDDHVRDKKAAPGLTKRQKAKQHFGRFKWWYLLGLVIFLAILLPILFKVIVPAIIQSLLNGQKLPINGGALQALSPTHVNMSLQTSLDTPLGVKLDPLDLYLYNKDTETYSPFLKLHLPEQHVKHKTDIIVSNQTLSVVNETELMIWFNKFFDEPEVKLSLKGEPKIHLGTLKYDPSLDKTIEVPSLNYLNGFSLRDMDFMLKSTDTKYNVKGNLNIPNSGVLTLGLGNLTFNLMSGETRLGLVNLYDVQLRPGNNSLPFDGNFFFDELVPNLSEVLDSQKGPLSKGYIELTATGNSTVVNGEHIKYAEGVLNKKHIKLAVPVITLLGDVVGGLLGADQGSLLDIFGGAIGNSTLFEHLLAHWDGEGSGRNETSKRSLEKRSKASGHWMLNLLRLGLRTRNLDFAPLGTEWVKGSWKPRIGRLLLCDESLPQCLRCLNMGLRCPGARTDAFFVHSASASSSSQLAGNLANSLVPQPRLPRPPPSSASAFDQLFVSHFIESFFGPMKPPPAPGTPSKIWLHELPVLLTAPGPSLAKHAIRATSMFSYGSLVDDTSIRVTASKWYAKALQDLQCLLSRGSIPFSESAVCAAVMLIHFETRAGTSQRAWLQHVKGAALLLEAGGPERCRSGFMHQIFGHLRFQTFIAAMTENQVSAFASPTWTTIPFEIHPKLVFDQLIDALFNVQKCLWVADQLIKSMTDIGTSELVMELNSLMLDAMFQLHQWYLGCISSGRFGESDSVQSSNPKAVSALLPGPEELLLPYQNVPAAALSSLYDSANIIILRLLHLVSPEAASHDARVWQHAQSILSAYDFINATCGPGPDRGSIMMVAQLKVVSLWSSSSQQRDTAAGMLQGERVQAGGLSDISAASNQYFADVAAHILKHFIAMRLHHDAFWVQSWNSIVQFSPEISMEIVIIGAGISGCAVYLELRKHIPETSSITIYEAYDTGKDTTAEQREQGETHSSTLLVGGGLAIAPNGLGVLRRLDEDLLRDVTGEGYVTSHSNLKDKNGNVLMRIEPNGPSKSTNANSASQMHSVACSRHSLWRCLRSRIPDEHIINKRVLNVTANANSKNVVRFADGSDSIEADLVVGADGVRSIAKMALFPESKDPYPPNYEGLVGIGGFVSAADVKEIVEKGSMNFIFGGNGFFGYFFSDSCPSGFHRGSPFHVSEPGESLAWWSTYEIPECPDRKSLDLNEVISQLRERHSQWKDPVVQKILDSAHIQNMYPTWTSPQLPTWQRDGVVLLGDAAHALPPTSGQGTSQALEDCEAFVLFLSHQIGKIDTQHDSVDPEAMKQAINTAAKQYLALRQPRVREILEAAQKIQTSKRNMGVIQEYTMYTFMKIMGKSVSRTRSEADSQGDRLQRC
ncbi:hypothetical protein FALBO_10059 [Fusarium albosuccineum]|uniref:FAD-binding domain-containing protein n=1 Tax=Fusarium albosuccineum TaxID=1237068 RepID=A0A8H4L7P6_9HYPO|nr:hypothetical protein FALBO_10059 [Fusarium albosuccineum]